MREAVFIGYRRADTGDVAGRLYDALSMAFGERQIFKDVDSIPLGADFAAHIRALLPKCRVFLALIGPDWVGARDGNGLRRLDDANDLVRVEIERALATPKLLVVPVLVNGARMPEPAEVPESIRPLLQRHAAVIRRDPDFKTDVTRLLDALRDHLRTGRLDLQSLGGAARVATNAAGLSGWLVLAWLTIAGLGVTVAVPQLREPILEVVAGAKPAQQQSAPITEVRDIQQSASAPEITQPAVIEQEALPPPPVSPPQSLGGALSVTLISLVEDQDRYIATLRFENASSEGVGVAVLWDGFATGQMVLTDSLGGSCGMIANGESWGTMSTEQLEHYIGEGDFRPLPANGRSQQTIFFNKGRCASQITADSGLVITGSFIVKENGQRRAAPVYFEGLALQRRE